MMRKRRCPSATGPRATMPLPSGPRSAIDAVIRPTASVDAYSDQVLDLLDALHVERAVVCGLSMGGYVTFALLRRAQDRVSGIVLADTRSTADSPEILRMREGMLERLQGGGASAVAVDMQPKLFGPATYRKRPAVIASVRQFIERQPPDAIADAIRAMMTRPDSGALLSSLRMPALVIVGEDDVMTPPSDAEGMHAAIAGSSLVRLPGVGHMSNLEDPHAFNAAVADFLRGLKPKA